MLYNVKQGINIMKDNINKVKVLPTNCPSCEKQLNVKRLVCSKCETEVEGLYPLPNLASLSASDQEFILQFIKNSGSLKEMARIMNISYPTIRNKLDNIIELIKSKEGGTK